MSPFCKGIRQRTPYVSHNSAGLTFGWSTAALSFYPG